MHNQYEIDQAITECRTGHHVAHVSQQYQGLTCDRVVAIRPGTKGKFNLTFSDPRFDLRATGDTIYNVTARQARRLIQTFFWSFRVHISEFFTLFINQGDRDCRIVEDSHTPTRVRIEYEMPVAGTMGSWCHATRLGDFFYISL